jgi:hypothetical protein
MRQADNRIQFRASPRVMAFLERRAGEHDMSSRHIQASADVDTLQALIAAELRRIPLSVSEALFLADLVDGRQPAPGTAMLYVEGRHALGVARADMAVPGAQSGQADIAALLGKLERLGPAADFALCDALASWKARDLKPTAEGFAQAGLRITSATRPRTVRPKPDAAALGAHCADGPTPVPDH